MAQTVLPEKAGVVFSVSFPRKPRHIAEREMKFVKKNGESICMRSIFDYITISWQWSIHGFGVTCFNF